MARCVFINLDEATERRALLEVSWPSPPGWTLERFQALRPAQPGPLSAGALGCFLSHRAVLATSLDNEDPLFVLEDDALMGPSTFKVLDELLKHPQDWDLLFTDTIPLDMMLLSTMARQRAEYATNPLGLHIHPLRGRPWVGTTAYVVRGPAKRRLYELLCGADLTRPYDLFLRDLSDQGGLSVAACLPFLTAPSTAASASQISAGSSRGAEPLMLFRRLMFLDRDLARCEREAEALRAGQSADARIVGAVVGSLISSR